MPKGGHSRLAQFEDCPVIVCDIVFQKLLIMMIILMVSFSARQAPCTNGNTTKQRSGL